MGRIERASLRDAVCRLAEERDVLAVALARAEADRDAARRAVGMLACEVACLTAGRRAGAR